MLINPNSISFVDFCDKYNLPGEFYDIFRIVKQKLNIQKKQKVVIIVDEFSSNTIADQKKLLLDLFKLLDNQHKHSDCFESVDLIITTLEISHLNIIETSSSRGFDFISLPSLKNSIKLFKRFEEFYETNKLNYLVVQCGGHPRTLEFLSDTLQINKNVPFNMIKLMNIVQDKLSNKYKFHNRSNIVKAVLIRKSVHVFDTKFSLSENTDLKNMDQLIGEGILIFFYK